YKLSELVLNGFHSMIHCGVPDRYPLKKGGHVCLYQGGLIAALATLGAFWANEEQGLGQHVDVSLMETQAGDVDRKNIDLLAWSYSGDPVHAIRTDYEAWLAKNILPFGTFPCQDGFIVSLPIVTHWPRFVELMKMPELADRYNFPEDIFDMDVKGEIDVMWYEWLAERTKEEAMADCQAARWFGTAVQTPRDVVEDSHFKERGFWQEVEHPVMGRLTYPGAPVRVGPDSWQVRLPAPTLGQHNAEVYIHQLGYTNEDLQKFKETGVIYKEIRSWPSCRWKG
ncbi:MAG: CoA transferase, partial [Deltaproteobacteria bacterium]|nr:CoA transferase [Deltaproteobacteria bacterium]